MTSRSRRFFLMGLAATALVALVAVPALCLTAGCSSVGYYAQSVDGHLRIVEAARPVSTWIADPATPPKLKQRLVLAQQIRDFAVAELKEPDNASYRRYAALDRPAAVWNVVAAPELSLEPKTWCFVVVGCVAYRGYYDKAEAERLAAELRGQGFDAAVNGVPAYSTLGRLPRFDWLADPLLSTFIDYPDVELARLVFHELAHQIAFAPGDTLFNESFASAVEKIGAERWLAERGSAAQREAAVESERRRADFRALTEETRSELAAIYAGPGGDDAKRSAKADALRRLRQRYETLKTSRWNGYRGYDGWIARADNGSFALLANYTALVPAFESLWQREGRDFDRFYAEVKRIAALPSAERRAALGP